MRSQTLLPEFISSKWIVRTAGLFLVILVFILTTAASPTPPPPTPATTTNPHLPAPEDWYKPKESHPEMSTDQGEESDGQLSHEYVYRNWISLVYQVWNYYTGWDLGYKEDTWDYTSMDVFLQTDDNEYNPRFNVDASQVVFVSDHYGSSELFRINTDGQNLIRLTNNPAEDAQPDWSQANGLIAFVSDRDGYPNVYRMDANGAATQRLTNAPVNDLYPTWSPDGKRLAWIRSNGISGRIWLMNADGSDQHPITTAYLPFAEDLIWSPDGQKLALDYDQNGDGWLDLVVINLDGSNQKVIILGSPNAQYDCWAGSWGWDSKGIYYTRAGYQAWENEWYLIGTTIHYASVVDFSGYSIFSEITANPDNQPRDPFPPVTRVNPLPAYSHKDGFPVSWSAYDLGISGLRTVALQVQMDNQDWQPWTWGSYTSPFSYFINGFQGLNGNVVSFRSRGVDLASNDEPENQSKITTTLYQSQLDGQITDNRGFPTADGSVWTEPGGLTTSDLDAKGWYHTYLAENGAYTLHLGDTVSNPADPVDLEVLGDTRVDLSLAPVDSQIQNGGFESQEPFPDQWISGGNLPVTPIPGHTGQQAIRLGGLCGTGCPAVPGPADNMYSYNIPVMDHQGIGHVIEVTNDSFTELTIDTNGNWSRQPGLDLGVGSIYSDQSYLIVDGQDGLHLIVHFNDRNIRKEYYLYLHKVSGSTWSSPEKLFDGGNPNIFKLASNSIGQVAILYSCWPNVCKTEQNGNYVKYRETNGSWGAPIFLDDKEWFSTGAIALDDLGVIHLVHYQDRNIDNTDDATYYQEVYPDRSVSNPTYIFPGFRSIISIEAQNDGGIQIVLKGQNDYSVFIERLPGGRWLDPFTLPGFYNYSMISDQLGTVHLIINKFNINHEDPIFAWEKKRGVQQFSIEKLPGDSSIPALLAVNLDQAGNPHYLWQADSPDLLQAYTPAEIMPDGGTVTLSQTVPVPANLHRPTLAFMYRLPQKSMLAEGGSTAWVRVQGSDQETTRQLTPVDEWTLAWLDLEDFAGGEATISFEVDQTAGDVQLQLDLDDVSLGSWLTPVFTSVTPNQADLPLPAGATVVIRGENFIEGCQVFFGDLQAPQVEWIDETTLRVTLPDTTQIGRLPITIVNPAGYKAIEPGAFQMGQLISLPLIFQ